jgi:hypothetical protein
MTWQMCSVFFPRRLIDGTYANGDLMWRQVNGQVQYRRPTKEEEAEDFSTMAW